MRLPYRRSELAGAQIGTNSYGYAYDTIGNRTSDTFNGASRSYVANCLNQYTVVNRTIEQSEQSNNLAYDADGNLTNDGRFTYVYDAENRLRSSTSIAETNGAIRVLNAYDHRHRRIRKTVQHLRSTIAPPHSPPVGTHEWQTTETHDFVWDCHNIVLETITFADGTTRICEYFWGPDKSGTEQGAGGVGGLLAVSIDGGFYIPCYDHNGNIVCYVSETGSIAAQYVYDPYGNIIEAVGSNVDLFSFGFSTKYYDRETGMVGYQRRFYRPSHGRWLNRDPIEEDGGENLYQFCMNTPASLFDINGEIAWETCLQGLFQTVSGVFLGYSAIGSLWMSGFAAAPVAVPLLAWASLSVANGIRTLNAGFHDKGSPEALQVVAVQSIYSSLSGNDMSDRGVAITRICYLLVDIRCSCYSIKATWQTYFRSREVFIPAYGSEISSRTRQGIRVIEVSSEMRFIGTGIGVTSQGGSMILDFKSIYENSVDFIEEAEEIFINPDVGYGTTK